jgi:hypothetical protein
VQHQVDVADLVLHVQRLVEAAIAAKSSTHRRGDLEVQVYPEVRISDSAVSMSGARAPDGAAAAVPQPVPASRGMLEGMCRNIRVLHNFDPPATDDEIKAAAVQYVRKVSGTTRPSAANQEAFDEAGRAVTEATRALLESLVTKAPPRDREVEAAKAQARAAERYGPREPVAG